MRIFRGLLFMGSGERSERGVDALRLRLNDALSYLSGLQQPPNIHMPSNPDEASRNAEAEIEIEEAVRDIASALTGREIHFGDEQPYPARDDEGIQVYLKAVRRQ